MQTKAFLFGGIDTSALCLLCIAFSKLRVSVILGVNRHVTAINHNNNSKDVLFILNNVGSLTVPTLCCGRSLLHQTRSWKPIAKERSGIPSWQSSGAD